jgi:hypothetical protein
MFIGEGEQGSQGRVIFTSGLSRARGRQLRDLFARLFAKWCRCECGMI